MFITVIRNPGTVNNYFYLVRGILAFVHRRCGIYRRIAFGRARSSLICSGHTLFVCSASFEEKAEGIGGGIGMAVLRTWALARLGIGRNLGEVP